MRYLKVIRGKIYLFKTGLIMIENKFEVADKILREVVLNSPEFRQVQALQLFGDLLDAKLTNANNFFDFWYNFYIKSINKILIEDNEYLYLETKFYQLLIIQLLNGDDYQISLKEYLNGLYDFIVNDKYKERDAIEKYQILSYLGGIKDYHEVKSNGNFDLLHLNALGSIKEIIKTSKNRLRNAGSLSYGFHHLLLIVFLKHHLINLELIKKEMEELNIKR